MTPLLTHLRNAARACTTGYEISLSINEVRQIVAMLDDVHRLREAVIAVQPLLPAVWAYNEAAQPALQQLAAALEPLSSPEEIAQFIDAMQTAPLAITPPGKEDL